MTEKVVGPGLGGWKAFQEAEVHGCRPGRGLSEEGALLSEGTCYPTQGQALPAPFRVGPYTLCYRAELDMQDVGHVPADTAQLRCSDLDTIGDAHAAVLTAFAAWQACIYTWL